MATKRVETETEPVEGIHEVPVKPEDVLAPVVERPYAEAVTEAWREVLQGAGQL